MAITSRGYVGALVPGLPWAQMQWIMSREYVVSDQNAWKPTPLSGGTRQVSIAAGVGGGKGILDVVDAAVTVTLPTVSSGTSYFMIVARRTWGPTSGESSTAFTYVGPTSSSTTLPAKQSTPGTVDDQPVAFVSLSSTSTLPVIVDDLRIIGTGWGELIALSDKVRQFMIQVGTQVRIAPLGTQWTQSLTPAGTGSLWVQAETINAPVPLAELTQSDVWVSQDATGAGTGWSGAGDVDAGVLCRAVPNGNRVDIYLTLRRTGARIVPDGAGGITDVQVGATAAGLRPAYPIPALFMYRGGSVATNKATYHGSATLYPTGQLNLNALSPGIPLNQSAATDDWSGRFFFSFNRKG